MKRDVTQRRIVTIGGGTGTYTVLRGLKHTAHHLTAVVSMMDSGGSTGRLRDEFGVLPVGDVRMALTALADDDHLLRDLFLYRFAKGEGLAGHNVGNLLLVALTDLLGSETRAIEHASRILRVRGSVVPVTETHAHLVARYSDGRLVRGEASIDEPPKDFPEGVTITELRLEPRATATHEARSAIMRADMIVIGPGDVYTSLLPNILVEGIADSLRETAARLVYIVNLMTKFGQTTGMTARDHVALITEYIGRAPDTVVMHSGSFDNALRERYATQREYPVVDDLDGTPFHVVRGNLCAGTTVTQSASDTVRRSLIRHDSVRLARILADLLD